MKYIEEQCENIILSAYKIQLNFNVFFLHLTSLEII